MAAVNMKLSRQDAKYLTQLLDAVSAATVTIEPSCREHPHGPGKNELGHVIRCTDCIAREHTRRVQALHNASPFGDFKSTHAFALRIGLSLLTATNIADQHSE